MASNNNRNESRYSPLYNLQELTGSLTEDNSTNQPSTKLTSPAAMFALINGYYYTHPNLQQSRRENIYRQITREARRRAEDRIYQRPYQVHRPSHIRPSQVLNELQLEFLRRAQQNNYLQLQLRSNTCHQAPLVQQHRPHFLAPKGLRPAPYPSFLAQRRSLHLALGAQVGSNPVYASTSASPTGTQSIHEATGGNDFVPRNQAQYLAQGAQVGSNPVYASTSAFPTGTQSIHEATGGDDFVPRNQAQHLAQGVQVGSNPVSNASTSASPTGTQSIHETTRGDDFVLRLQASRDRRIREIKRRLRHKILDVKPTSRRHRTNQRLTQYLKNKHSETPRLEFEIPPINNNTANALSADLYNVDQDRSNASQVNKKLFWPEQVCVRGSSSLTSNSPNAPGNHAEATASNVNVNINVNLPVYNADQNPTTTYNPTINNQFGQHNIQPHQQSNLQPASASSSFDLSAPGNYVNAETSTISPNNSECNVNAHVGSPDQTANSNTEFDGNNIYITQLGHHNIQPSNSPDIQIAVTSTSNDDPRSHFQVKVAGPSTSNRVNVPFSEAYPPSRVDTESENSNTQSVDINEGINSSIKLPWYNRAYYDHLVTQVTHKLATLNTCDSSDGNRIDDLNITFGKTCDTDLIASLQETTNDLNTNLGFGHGGNTSAPTPFPSPTSSDNLALVTENNDAQFLQYSRNIGNFFPRNTRITPHIRAPPAEISGVAIETEQFFDARSAGERRATIGASAAAVQPPSLSSTTVANFNATLPTAIGFVSTSSRVPNCVVPGGTSYVGGDNNDELSRQLLIKLNSSANLPTRSNQEQYNQRTSPVLDNIEVSYSLGDDILGAGAASDLSNTSPYNIIAGNSGEQHLSTSDIASDMKYETQSGPPTAQSHMTSSGVEPPHSSQGSGMMVDRSPADAEGVTVMLPWNGVGPDYLDQSDIKQAGSGHMSDTWDSILIEQPLDVPQSIAADRRPLPSFIGYTSHLSINGIPGHHYHTIASSAQRSAMPSGSPTQSTNPEYYTGVPSDTLEYQESPVVSSSTPCQQGNQKQQQQHMNNQQHCPHHPHHNHNPHQQQQQQQQQQLPQSTQPLEYEVEIDADIAQLIGSAIAADTTVSSGGSNGNGGNNTNGGNTANAGSGSNGGASSLVPDQDTASRDASSWNDIADWFDSACSNNRPPDPNSYPVYTTNPPAQTQHSSALQNLLSYSPLLQARLQAGNTETPSSTSTYPPVSPPGRVSTSGSPDQNLHSSYAAPSHSRKRSRTSQASGNPAKKAAISYANDANMAGGKEKPVHRCQVCNRGFLNKSNIKVHLRTHTGEKPFKCEVCDKAFRQKAHLIKHQQIHKRGNRD